MYPLQDKNIQAVVVHCSDPRIQQAMTEFLKQRGIDRISPIAVPGGLYEVVRGNMRSMVDFMMGHFQPAHLIVVNHTDCGWYRTHECLDHLHQDCSTALEELSAAFPGATVEAYVARLESDTIHFDEIEPSTPNIAMEQEAAVA